jgi:hypothetical protein
MTFILPSFGASAISAVPGGGGGGALSNTYSVDFDGTNDYVDTGSTFQSTFRSNHSISFWMKRNRLAPEAVSGTHGSERHQFYLDASNLYLMYYTGAGTNFTVYDSVNWNTTDWFHVVGTVEQSGSLVTVKIYLDGSLLVSSTRDYGANALSGYTTTLDYVIGKRHRPGGSEIPFDGLVDEFAIIPSALSASDVTSIYNSGVPADISSFSPVGWWRMGDNDGGTGTTITDQGSGGNDGTLTNGPTFSTTVPS